ncbi:heat-inducible transcriptional repressor HrcA [Garciella nitratireducens]|uniref:Heat-inducible transcription repressor HrcA n=1 Tax=Garciella nitratireducens DSM 15102 TaxID=1121911 RepID=A0A1T4JR44_9FIRM|nr:heat-inducible transcriptional repressor HrcA [Garciella nitratireducens]SJZ32594.1 heat-inducible transcription repressor HrcA [Garciella nitratireducens DSM 15102]
MDLKERKLKILNAIIQDYISTAEPVGSRTIAKNYNLGVSPATIRNEMADLEEMGYLEQPHTSSGRIPSDKAYRLYVDHLMRVDKLNGVIEETINREYKKFTGELENMLSYTSKILSQFTNYTSLALTPQLYESSIKHIQLMPLQEDKILMVIISKEGVVKNISIKTKKIIEVDTLNKFSNILNECLKGSNIFQVEEQVIEKLTALDKKESMILQELMPIIRKSLSSPEDIKIYSNGITNIFNFPEFKDIERAKDFIDLWEKKNILVELLSHNKEEGIRISIGKENKLKEIKGCSLITATYQFNGKVLGTIGVIGPTRMQYSKVVALLDYLTKQLEKSRRKTIQKENK